MKLFLGAAAILGLCSCSIYQTTVVPVYRTRAAAEKKDPFLLVADIEAVDSRTATGYTGKFGDLEQALKETSYLRYSRNARVAVRYRLDYNGSDSHNTFLACVSLLTIPGRETKKWKLRFDVYDRLTEESLLTYSYNVRRHEYFGHLVWLIGAPVAGALEGVHDMVDSVSTDKARVQPARLVVDRFMNDLQKDFKARAQMELLTAGAKLDGTMLLGRFGGNSGYRFAPLLQHELVVRDLSIAQNRADRRFVLHAQSRRATGLYAREIKIGRLAGATSILLGEVQLHNENAKGRFRLLNVERGVVVWSQRYEIRGIDSNKPLLTLANAVARDLARVKGRI